jgi:misacylated tRNA(Ala) deacylase
MMTELLYQTDAYLKEFDAEITGLNEAENGVYLNRTAFYPGGGGQPNDTGILLINGQEIAVKTIKKGNLHIIDGALPAIGTKLKGILNWERRHKLMRTHTAMHILCGVVWRDYGTP